MLLTIDIGNTNVTLGLYKGNILGSHWRLATDHARMPDEYGLQLLGLLQNARLTVKDLKGISLASVVPQLTGRVVQACKEYLEQDPFVVDVGIKTGIKVRYEDPRAVGADRIADAVAVMYLYGGPACVIDFGTATTFNAVTREGEYLGGAITAGINLATEALFTHAAKLPRIDLQRPPSVIGRNTVHAMQAGLLFGYVSMVEGMVERFRRELGPGMKVIATGGLAEVIAQETDVIQIIAPWLTLEGLRILWDLNHPL
ncbi:MAG: type III pantothenate kinase [Bacteroidota bacterium]|jgi:type III pantothenate kinase